MYLKTTSIRRLGRACKRVLYSTQQDFKALDHWIESSPSPYFRDTFNIERLSNLYVTLPTRDGSRSPYAEPRSMEPLGYGHHLAFFYPRNPEAKLREDGTDAEISPPAPFLTRMWAGGKMSWNAERPLLVGSKATASARLSLVTKKGFEKGKPKVFVNQIIDIVLDGHSTPSVVEERVHVYLTDSAERSKVAREVADLPTRADFSFVYKPTAATLFRFSAVTFNAHRIHLDRLYVKETYGYPERLIHGPMTALMLLETVGINSPKAALKKFEYRATNPLVLGHELTINGAWINEKLGRLWCVNDEGVVGMTGSVELQ